MLFLLFVSMILSSFRPCEGCPTYQEEYRNSSYVPTFIGTPFGFQIIAPATPYVAAAGRNSLYFIDTCFDHDSAQHIKNQIERATIPLPDEYTAIDEITATAEQRNGKTGETTFVFDPPYVRVMFAEGINKHNPELKLPEHEPAGDQLVTYDLDAIKGEKNTALKNDKQDKYLVVIEAYLLVGNNLSQATKRVVCSNFECYTNAHCIESCTSCDPCQDYRVDNESCASHNIHATGPRTRFCTKAVDTPKEDGETDASYYERMDKLHWH